MGANPRNGNGLDGGGGAGRVHRREKTGSAGRIKVVPWEQGQRARRVYRGWSVSGLGRSLGNYNLRARRKVKIALSTCIPGRYDQRVSREHLRGLEAER